jgi:hypothetical protein
VTYVEHLGELDVDAARVVFLAGSLAPHMGADRFCLGSQGGTMTQEHIDDLQKARDALVRERRFWAKTLAGGGTRRGDTEAATKRIVEVQQAIDAVDEALEEENREP